MSVQFPDVTVELSGMDGNAVAVFMRVARAISRKHGHDAGQAFRAEALRCESYDEVLQLVMNTVETK